MKYKVFFTLFNLIIFNTECSTKKNSLEKILNMTKTKLNDIAIRESVNINVTKTKQEQSLSTKKTDKRKNHSILRPFISIKKSDMHSSDILSIEKIIKPETNSTVYTLPLIQEKQEETTSKNKKKKKKKLANNDGPKKEERTNNFFPKENKEELKDRYKKEKENLKNFLNNHYENIIKSLNITNLKIEDITKENNIIFFFQKTLPFLSDPNTTKSFNDIINMITRPSSESYNIMQMLIDNNNGLYQIKEKLLNNLKNPQNLIKQFKKKENITKNDIKTSIALNIIYDLLERIGHNAKNRDFLLDLTIIANFIHGDYDAFGSMI